MTEKNQTANQTDDGIKAEQEDTQTVNQSQNSVKDADNNEVKGDHMQEDSQESNEQEDVDPTVEKIQELEKLANDNEEKYLRPVSYTHL